MNYYQTGDYLYFERATKPTGLKEIKSGVLVKSPTTGHAHRVVNGKLFKDESGRMWIESKKKATLKHEEHKNVDLPKGIYEVKQVMEYDHLLEESRAVID